MLKTVSTQLALASDTLSEILAKGNTSGASNIVMDSGYGIDFSATAGTGTSELFEDYEQGVWSPGAENYDGTMTVNAATYEKIGRQVTVRASVSFSATADASGMTITGLPYAHAAASAGYTGAVYDNGNGVINVVHYQSLSKISGNKYDGTSVTYTALISKTIEFTYIYYV
jgi:hypothetical protein